MGRGGSALTHIESFEEEYYFKLLIGVKLCLQVLIYARASHANASESLSRFTENNHTPNVGVKMKAFALKARLRAESGFFYLFILKLYGQP